MDNSATVNTNQIAYPMENKSRVNVQHQSSPREFANNVAPQIYDGTGYQPQRNLQPQVHQYNDVHTQQPGGHIFIALPPGQQLSKDYNDVIGYCALSICSTMCFWPVGIAAIAMSVMFFMNKRDGNYEKAKKFSRWSLCLSISAILCGVILVVIIVVVTVTLAPDTDNTNRGN